MMSLTQSSPAPSQLRSKNRQAQTHTFPVPQPGVYVPAITFFDRATDSLCPAEQATYFRFLSHKTGLTGLLVLGTNAETFLLTREERRQLIRIARASVPRQYTLIAGVSGHSTAQVNEYIRDAYEEGADYVLVLPCAYFGKQTTPEVVKEFFAGVAKQSALPILIYNFPAVCNGLDLDSDIIAELAKENVNIVGVKLTCGSVAKIARLAATFSPDRFAVFGGQSDFLVGGLAAGSAGCIAAFANVFPSTVVKIFDLWTAGKIKEAYELQQIASLAESPTKAGIANTKYAAAIFTASRAGIANAEELLQPRAPYAGPSEAVKKRIRDVMREASEKEIQIANAAASRL